MNQLSTLLLATTLAAQDTNTYKILNAPYEQKAHRVANAIINDTATPTRTTRTELGEQIITITIDYNNEHYRISATHNALNVTATPKEHLEKDYTTQIFDNGLEGRCTMFTQGDKVNPEGKLIYAIDVEHRTQERHERCFKQYQKILDDVISYYDKNNRRKR